MSTGIYCVVKFQDENSIEVVRSEWINEKTGYCAFPPPKMYPKVIKKSLPNDEIEKWFEHRIIVKKRGFGMYYNFLISFFHIFL